MNPLNARTALKMRPLTSFVLTLGIFLVFAFMVSPLPIRWVLDGVGIVVAFFLYFFVLPNRPMHLQCTKCHQVLATNTPWVCGFCGKRNEDTDRFPVINRCAHCGAEAKAYRCHHQKDGEDCGELIFLSQDRQKYNFAYCATLPAPVVDKRGVQEVEIQEKKNQIVLEQLDQKLKTEREKTQPKEQKPLAELIEEKIDTHSGKRLAVLEAVRKKKAQNALKYPNDMDARRLADLAVDEAAQNLLTDDE